MKIAFALFKYFSFGGLQLDTMRTVRELLSRGCQVSLFVGETTTDLPEIPGFSVHTIPLTSRSNHARADEFGKKFRLMTEGFFDVTVAMNRITGCDFYFAADDCILDHFLQKHSRAAVALLPRYRTFTRIERELFSPGSRTEILYLAERQKAAFQRRYGTEEKRFHLLPPGIPEKYRSVRTEESKERIREIRAQFGIREDEFLVLFIGSNFLLKGLDRAIRILARLPEEEKRKTRLLAVGPGRQKQVLPLIRRSGLEKNIVFAGPRNDTEAILPSADLLVLLSYSEATGTVIAESLCCGVPVLCSENCGFSTLARAAGSEVVPLPWSDETALALFRRILNDPEDYREKARTYSAQTDFFLRASRMADILMEYVQKKKGGPEHPEVQGTGPHGIKE